MDLNNENSLVLNVLESIDNINASCASANTSVGNALIDLYIKEANMISYARIQGKELIQESWFDYKKGESILKTIFLFIPRLIIGIFRNIKNAFNKAIDEAEQAEEEYQKELARLQKQEAEDMIKELNAIYEAVPNVRILNGPDGVGNIYYQSLIKSFEDLDAYLEAMGNACENYRKAVKDIDIEKFAKGEQAIPLGLFSVFHGTLSKSVSDVINQEGHRTTYLMTAYKKKMKNSKKIVEKVKTDSTAAMSEVSEMYNKMVRQSISYDAAGYSSYAKTMLDDFRAIYDDLQKVLVVWSTEQSQYSQAIKELRVAEKEYHKLAREQEIKKQTREDTKEADKLAEKWGVDLDG